MVFNTLSILKFYLTWQYLLLQETIANSFRGMRIPALVVHLLSVMEKQSPVQPVSSVLFRPPYTKM